LRDRDALKGRHEAIACLLENFEPVQKTLRRFSDVERITSRLALRNVRPRELAGLRDSLMLLPGLRNVLPEASSLLKALREDLAPPADCLALLQKAIQLEPAARLIDGGVMADGYSAEL